MNTIPIGITFRTTVMSNTSESEIAIVTSEFDGAQHRGTMELLNNHKQVALLVHELKSEINPYLWHKEFRNKCTADGFTIIREHSTQLV